MPCMSKTSKMERGIHRSRPITSLILNGFSIRKKFWKDQTQSFPTIPSNSMYGEACRRCRRSDPGPHPRAVMLCMSKMLKIDQRHLRAVMLCHVCRRCIALNALNTVQKIKAMSKMSKIDQIHLRAVMLCMSKTSKMHTNVYELQCRF